MPPPSHKKRGKSYPTVFWVFLAWTLLLQPGVMVMILRPWHVQLKFLPQVLVAEREKLKLHHKVWRESPSKSSKKERFWMVVRLWHFWMLKGHSSTFLCIETDLCSLKSCQNITLNLILPFLIGCKKSHECCCLDCQGKLCCKYKVPETSSCVWVKFKAYRCMENEGKMSLSEKKSWYVENLTPTFYFLGTWKEATCALWSSRRFACKGSARLST